LKIDFKKNNVKTLREELNMKSKFCIKKNFKNIIKDLKRIKKLVKTLKKNSKP